MENYITIKQMANKLNLDRSNARKYILKLGYKFKKIRTKDSKNQMASVLTQNEFDEIRIKRHNEYLTDNIDKINFENGYFYIIQLIPEYNINRLKYGFTINLKDRLSQHKTSAPTAIIYKYWSCKKIWELPIIDYLSKFKSKHISNEVYEVEDLDLIVEKANEIFNILNQDI